MRYKMHGGPDDGREIEVDVDSALRQVSSGWLGLQAYVAHDQDEAERLGELAGQPIPNDEIDLAAGERLSSQVSTMKTLVYAVERYSPEEGEAHWRFVLSTVGRPTPEQIAKAKSMARRANQ